MTSPSHRTTILSQHQHQHIDQLNVIRYILLIKRLSFIDFHSFQTVCRWQRNTTESDQQLCARMHVLLLHDVSDGTAIPEVSVVEEIHDRVANCK